MSNPYVFGFTVVTKTSELSAKTSASETSVKSTSSFGFELTSSTTDLLRERRDDVMGSASKTSDVMASFITDDETSQVETEDEAPTSDNLPLRPIKTRAASKQTSALSTLPEVDDKPIAVSIDTEEKEEELEDEGVDEVDDKMEQEVVTQDAGDVTMTQAEETVTEAERSMKLQLDLDEPEAEGEVQAGNEKDDATSEQDVVDVGVQEKESVVEATPSGKKDSNVDEEVAEILEAPSTPLKVTPPSPTPTPTPTRGSHLSPGRRSKVRLHRKLQAILSHHT